MNRGAKVSVMTAICLVAMLAGAPVPDLHDSFVTPPSPCPGCGHEHDRAAKTDAASEGPKPGDLAVCHHCGALNEYSDALELVTCPPEVEASLDPDQRAQLATMREAFRILATDGAS